MTLAQRVGKTLVTSGTEAATVAALTAGDYVVLVHGKAANAVLDEGDKFQVVVGKADGTTKYSDPIKTKDIKSVRIEEYRAPVNQVVTVTVGTIVPGLEYELVIVNKADKEILHRRQDKRSYSLLAGASDSAATLAQKFTDMINDDQAAPVTATVSGAAITLTAKTKANTLGVEGQPGVQNYFQAGIYQADLQGYFTPAGTVVNTTAPDFGNGTFPQVRTLEYISAGYDGMNDLNRRQYPVRQPSYDSVPGDTYDIITIEYDNSYFSNSVAWGKVTDPVTLILAVEAGNTADLEAIFANYIVD